MRAIIHPFSLKALATLFLALFGLTSLGAQQFGTGERPAPPILRASFGNATAEPGRLSLPPRADLSALFPPPGNQANQNSCVAWATAYAARSYHENVERGWAPLDRNELFSPSYVYNQINEGVDEGSYISDALALLVEQGGATLSTMAYTMDYLQSPSQAARREAALYKAQSYEWIDGQDKNALRSALNDGVPLIFGMAVHESFYDYDGGIYDGTWGTNYGGHAMVLVGYDDQKAAYKLMNSWGQSWGEGGFGWIDYDLFANLAGGAYAFYDQRESTPETIATPLNPRASEGASSTSITFQWDQVNNARAYEVARSSTPNSGYQSMGTTEGNTYVDQNLSAGSEFYYIVRAIGETKTSEFSSIARGTTATPRQQELGRPILTDGQYKDNFAYMLWDAIEGAEGYYIYRWNSESEGYAQVGRSRNTGFRYLIRDPNPVERFIVTAYRGQTEGDGSDVIELVTGEAQGELIAPRNLSASQGEFRSAISVKWDPVAGATSYAVVRWSSVAKSWEVLDFVAGTEYEDDRLGPLDVAYYAVVARNREQVSSYSDYAKGWVSGASVSSGNLPQAVDGDYREEYVGEVVERLDNGNFFSDDSFFGGNDFFDGAFGEKDYFFGDTEAFFNGTENFFQGSANFFEGSNDFFGGSRF